MLQSQQPMYDRGLDAKVRAAAFAWLETKVEENGDVLPRGLLAEGFRFEGQRIPLLGPQGIFKPAVLTAVPLSITTSPNGPYDDTFRGRFLKYRYRGTNAAHVDNVGLRTAMRDRLPLVYFHGVLPGRYVAAWPVYIVGDDVASLTFEVAFDDAADIVGRLETFREDESVADDMVALRRAYVTGATKVRLHQRAFRERVLSAYRRSCAFCRFRHPELLDAAHITPDKEADGEPIVQNGLALCSLHHGAFDRTFLGVTPDYRIEVRPDLLEEKDGPTLKHAIQDLHGQRILLPGRKAEYPDPERLTRRYETFLTACGVESARPGTSVR